VPNVLRVASSSATPARQPSKLAMLAQAKAQQGHWMPKAKKVSAAPSEPSLILHKTRTQYLDPIANGPTATTAITTSYQSLSSLMTSAQSAPPPSMLPSGRNVGVPSPKPGRSSKLAMKSKNAQRKAELEPDIDEPQPAADDPLFIPKATRTHKAGAPTSRRTGKERARLKDREVRDSTALGDKEMPKRKSHRRRDVPLPSTRELSPLSGFAFDVPSPDDIVFNARRGTSLAPRPHPTSTHLPHSTTSTASLNRSAIDTSAR